MKGRLEVITGPMFSGKTEELIRRLTRYQIAGKSINVFGPDIDNRYGEGRLHSHSGRNFECVALPVKGGIAKTNGEIIAFDEAQFFEEKWVCASIYDCIDNGKKIIVAGLDTDFRGRPFGAMPYLLAIADRVDKLTAICNICGEEANMTQRLVDGFPAPYSGETILVGAKDSYEARCRNCHQRG